MTVSNLEHAPVREGEILDAKYRVDRVIGAGGMGVVVAATHVQLQTRVALKFLLPEVLSSQQVVERFAREARAAVRIQSEHVARVTDVGTLANGAPYMVMEYLEGQDLAEKLAQSGPLSVAQAVGYLLQAIEAIAEAHALGIVHRDLKPANLFLAQRLRREPIVKVLDFGISKVTEGDSMGLTNTSALMGSPYYMSPEQMRSARDADARSDIWALGVILYELLAGTPPFQGDTITEIVVKVTQGHVPPIHETRADVPVGIAEVISRCLQRDPQQRYTDVAELAKALVPYGPPRSDAVLENIARILGAAVSAPPERIQVPPSGATGRAVATQATNAAWSHSRNDSRSSARGPILIAASLLAVTTIAILAWWFSTQVEKSPVAGVPTAVAKLGSAVAVSPDSTVSAPIPQPSSTPVIVPAQSASPVALAPAGEKSPPSTTPIRRVARPAVSPPPAKSAVPPPPVPPANRGLNMGMKE